MRNTATALMRRTHPKLELLEAAKTDLAKVERAAYLARIAEHGTTEYMRYMQTYYQHRMLHQDGPRRGLYVAPAPIHYTIGNAIDAALASKQMSPRVLIEVFRGSAKTTTACEGGLPRVINAGIRNVLLISATMDEVKARIQSVTHEIIHNERLKNDFPVLARQKDDKGQFTSYRDDQIVFANGARLKGYPFGGKLRGSLWNGERPGFVLIDDPETDEMQTSDTQLKKGRDWVTKTLIPALSAYCPVVWIGTPLSPRCLLYWVREELGWNGPRQPVYNEDGTPHWPEFWPEERIQAVRAEIGEHSFQQEYMLNALPDEMAAFEPADFDDNTYDQDLLHHHGGGHWEYEGKPLVVVTHYDAAISLSPDADRTAIVTVGADPQQNVYVLEVRVGRWPSPRQKQELINCHQATRTREIGYEESMLEMMQSQQVLEDTALPMVGVKIKRQKDIKELRIRNLAIPVKNRKVKFNDRDPVQKKELRPEMLNFPFGQHDDILDALERATTRALDLTSPGHGIDIGGFRDSVDDITGVDF